MSVRFTAADVTRALAGVKRFTQSGFIIVFDEGEGNSFILNKKTGQKTVLRE